MKGLEKLKKFQWKIILLFFFLLVTLSLNIWLGFMPVFKGSFYLGKSEHCEYKVSFGEETFNGYIKQSNERMDIYGFYFIGNLSSFTDGEDINKIVLDGKYYNNGSISDLPKRYYFQRENVFVIKNQGYYSPTDKYEDVKCFNIGAIFLQIFYLLVMILCTCLLIIAFAKKSRKK